MIVSDYSATGGAAGKLLRTNFLYRLGHSTLLSMEESERVLSGLLEDFDYAV